MFGDMILKHEIYMGLMVWQNIWVSSQSGLFDPLYNPRYIKFIFYTWPPQINESSKFGTYTYIVSLLAPIDFVTVLAPVA